MHGRDKAWLTRFGRQGLAMTPSKRFDGAGTRCSSITSTVVYTALAANQPDDFLAGVGRIAIFDHNS